MSAYLPDEQMVDALRSAMERAGGDWVAQPSRLRVRLEESLGPDARTERGRIHQLMVAADERVPIRLTRTEGDLEEQLKLADMLVTTRGWRPEAATWSVRTWAAALGYRPTEANSAAERETPAPLPPTAPAVPAATVLPNTPPAQLPAATVLPDTPPAQPPSPPTPIPPVATVLPAATVLPDTPPAQPSAPTPPPAPVTPAAPNPPLSPTGDAARRVNPELPTGHMKFASGRVTEFLGHSVEAAYPAIFGINLVYPFAIVLLAVIGIMIPQPGVMVAGAVLGAVASLWIRLQLRRALIAVDGDQVTVIAATSRASRPTHVLGVVQRDQVTYAGGGLFPSVRIDDRRLWFLPPFRGVPRALGRVPS